MLQKAGQRPRHGQSRGQTLLELNRETLRQEASPGLHRKPERRHHGRNRAPALPEQNLVRNLALLRWRDQEQSRTRQPQLHVPSRARLQVPGQNHGQFQRLEQSRARPRARGQNPDRNPGPLLRLEPNRALLLPGRNPVRRPNLGPPHNASHARLPKGKQPPLRDRLRNMKPDLHRRHARRSQNPKPGRPG